MDTFAALDALDAQIAERADVWRALSSLQAHVLDWTTGSVLAEDGTVRPRSCAQLHTLTRTSRADLPCFFCLRGQTYNE